MPDNILRIPYEEVVQLLTTRLETESMPSDRAALCAKLFADASRDGVPSHGLNRFNLFIKWIRAGTILPDATLSHIAGTAALERWDGNFGPGPWNAWHCMKRALELAHLHGIGCVALRRTNHWMRAGNYGWQAADDGCIGICWTNTIALMPAWGGKERRVGNNPLVIAVPRRDGSHVVLDMAMSQYSMGKLTLLRDAGQHAPLPAGFDAQGNQTRDPAEILKGGSAMPIGAWKGFGLALLLDMAAALVSGGAATHNVRAQENEKGVSQIFLAIDPANVGTSDEAIRIVENIVADVKISDAAIRYPGERSLITRRQSLSQGVPVDKTIWEKIITSTI